MNYVTILWSGAAAAALLLCVVHAAIWLLDRKAYANLALAVVAGSLTGIAMIELAMMVSGTPQEWAFWVRWCHLPVFVHLSGIVIFVRLYLGTGRNWLMWTIIVMRFVIVVANFSSDTNFNFARVDAVTHINFLGDSIAIYAAGQIGSWQWLATASVLLLNLYVLDATVTLWRRNGQDDRRKAVIIGGSMLIFLAMSVLSTQLVIWGLVAMPMLITPPFLISLSAMAFELGRDTLRAGRLSRDLLESESWLELAANASQLGFWTWDARHNAIWATERSRTLLGFGAKEPIVADALRSRIHSQDLVLVHAAFNDSADRKSTYCIQFRCSPASADASCRWVSSQGEVERDASGKLLLVRGVLRDVSDQKHAEHETQELRRTLTHIGRVTVLGQLSSALAHELSQPLGAILRNVEAAAMLLARRPPDIEELQAIVADIEKDDRRAGDVIDRLRSLLKRRELQLQPMSVDSVVNDANTLVRADATARHVALECVSDEALPLIAADRVHLLQVLINLIVNAMDATCDAHVTKRCVTVAAHASGQANIEISVADSGTGIADETLPRIFEPFFTTKKDGMGMGLTVSRTIIEAHGGRLSAENGSAGGAVFRVTLPILRGAVT